MAFIWFGLFGLFVRLAAQKKGGGRRQQDSRSIVLAYVLNKDIFLLKEIYSNS